MLRKEKNMFVNNLESKLESMNIHHQTHDKVIKFFDMF